MFDVVPFEIDHVKGMLHEEMNKNFIPLWTRDDYFYPQWVAQNSTAYTGIYNGVPVICAFLVELWAGRGYIVCVLSEKIKFNSISIYRGIQKKFLKQQPYDRLEMDVPVDLNIAHRRAMMLGFELVQRRAKKYLPDGSDASIYAWVRE